MAETNRQLPNAGTMRRTVERYISGLQRADFEAVGRCFDEAAFYSHSTYDGFDTLIAIEVTGRQAIVDMISAKRGARTWHHDIEEFVGLDGKCFIEGLVRDGRDGGVLSRFVGSGRFNDKGEITRWIAYRAGVSKSPATDPKT